jgi:hypothetical protein
MHMMLVYDIISIVGNIMNQYYSHVILFLESQICVQDLFCISISRDMRYETVSTYVILISSRLFN